MSKDSTTVISTASTDSILTSAKAALEKHRDVIMEKVAQLEVATLPDRLCIGLAALKAHEAFAVFPGQRKGRGGRPGKNSPTRGGVSEIANAAPSFEGWMAAEAPWLKSATAYKYMTAVRGLGLDHTATEKALLSALAKLEGPSLKSLCDAATEAMAPPALPAPTPDQQEFDFLREQLTHLREQHDLLRAIKSQLESNPDLLRAAASRAYHILRDLTGSDWAPSDDPADIASVDPDSISL